MKTMKTIRKYIWLSLLLLAVLPLKGQQDPLVRAPLAHAEHGAGGQHEHRGV